MSITVSTRSTEGFESTSTIRAFALDIDPTGEGAPDTLESLLSAYAACYIPALRVGAERADVSELGTIEIEAEGDTNDDGKLESITFTVTTDTGLDADDANATVARANALCKVHDALKGELHATVTIDGHQLD